MEAQRNQDKDLKDRMKKVLDLKPRDGSGDGGIVDAE